MTEHDHPVDPLAKKSSGSRWVKLLVFALVVLTVALVYWRFGASLNLAEFARRESQLRKFQIENPILVFGIAFLVYVLVTGLSIPGGAVLTLVYGWYFGFSQGLLLVSFASTAGATVAFLLSRFLFRDGIQNRFGDKLSQFNRAFEKEGPFFLFSLRLIPAVPFFVINAVMGLTPIRVATFWWVSQLGMLPGTIVYIYAGSSVPSIQSLAEKGLQAVFTLAQLTQILIAFVLLGLLPLVVRWAMKFARPIIKE